MYAQQPKDIDQLRAFCDIVDQQRADNMSKAVRYAAAWRRLYHYMMVTGDDAAQAIAQETRIRLEIKDCGMQSIAEEEPTNPKE